MKISFLLSVSLFAGPTLDPIPPTPLSDAAEPGGPGGFQDGADFAFLPGVWRVQGWALTGQGTRLELDGVLLASPWTDGLLAGFSKRIWSMESLPEGFVDFTESGLSAFEPSSVGYLVRDEQSGGWSSMAGWRPEYDSAPAHYEPVAVSATQRGGLRTKRTAGTDRFGNFEQVSEFIDVSLDGWTFSVTRHYDSTGAVRLCEESAERYDDRVEERRELLVGGEAATVRTLREGFTGSRGLATDPEGNLYYAGLEGDTGDVPILRRSPEGTTEVLVRGLKPVGLAWGKDALWVYAEDVEGGRIVKVDPKGEVTEVARVTGACLAVDRSDAAYVLRGRELLRVKADGDVEVWASSALLEGGFALTADDTTSSILVGTWTEGHVYRVRQGQEPERIGAFPGSANGRCAWIAMDGPDVLGTSFGGARVYRMAPDGTVSLVAGLGLNGGDDGPARSARFHNPNGIALSPDGRVVYVAEIRPGPLGPFAHGRLRAIELEP